MSNPLIPPPVIALAFGAAMALTARWFDVLPFAFAGQRVVAAASALAGLSIDALSLRAFFRSRTTVNPLRPDKTAVLVTDGIYGFSRNPMYLGLVLILCGVLLWCGDLVNVLPVALFVWTINTLQIKPEERALFARFGPEFDDYRRRVRRWL